MFSGEKHNGSGLLCCGSFVIHIEQQTSLIWLNQVVQLYLKNDSNKVEKWGFVDIGIWNGNISL